MIYAKASSVPTTSAVRFLLFWPNPHSLASLPTDPITSIVPTSDSQTLLVSTLDSHVRLLDLGTGKMLNTFSGHVGKEYRVRACFGAGEATVCCGDEEGRVWAWDLVDATVLQPNPPPKVHEKVITWTEHHPTDPGEMITASADGTCKVWRHPNQSA